MTRLLSILVIASSCIAGAQLSPLERARREVERFWDQFSSVSYSETVTQLRLGPNDKTIEERTGLFDSVTLLQVAGGELAVDESRIPQGRVSRPASKPLLTTAGFATLMLVLHAHYAASYTFTPLADDDVGNRRCHRVAFEHVKGSPTPTVLQLSGRDYPVAWRGVAWIDAQSGHVIRITASLRAPMEDIGLARMDTEVRYGPVTFSHPEETYWLPLVATIDLETRRQHWRNTHRFARYRRFSVDTKVGVATPVP